MAQVFVSLTGANLLPRLGILSFFFKKAKGSVRIRRNMQLALGMCPQPSRGSSSEGSQWSVGSPLASLGQTARETFLQFSNFFPSHSHSQCSLPSASVSFTCTTHGLAHRGGNKEGETSREIRRGGCTRKLVGRRSFRKKWSFLKREKDLTSSKHVQRL